MFKASLPAANFPSIKAHKKEKMAGQICYYGQLAKENGGCSFFPWLDPPMCERSKNVIPGLYIGPLDQWKKLRERLTSERGSFGFC
ncbi:hypothetical protein BUALT_Bualt15G0084800 [Buddleja alternifolia]|uniref:Uncharacterized protein n=1 Tax=Buddleja alternifolia TaxID=168488 RepID=A0AAV6WDL5_9LAMI|nr:hypothetical protein BUALT_Bualt15G0084800 [Buddleja alternifolia]